MTAQNKYLRVSPRGFANEAIIFRVPADKVAEAEKAYATFEDNTEQGGNAAWVKGPFHPGAIVDWADRHLV